MSLRRTPLQWRAVRLAASAWVTPERVRSAIADVLGQRDPVTAERIIRILEEAAGFLQLAPRSAVLEAGRALDAAQARTLLVGEPDYPEFLARAWPELGAPVWLFARVGGHAARLPKGPAVAVVGTRRPTMDGIAIAERLGSELAAAGIVVVSGMAKGIDQAAHRGALSGGGRAVGVLGTGFGVDYPRGDGKLREAVAESGGLVTEYLPGTPPRPPHFLWRNRIIAGLAELTVVVEGRERSGALATARLAAAQGREVLAVPGSINLPTSQGPLALMRDGVRPLTRVDDVLELLGLPAGGDPTASATGRATEAAGDGLSPGDRMLLDLLGTVPVSADDLIAGTGLPVGTVLATIGRLVARGLAAPSSGGYVRRSRSSVVGFHQ